MSLQPAQLIDECGVALSGGSQSEAQLRMVINRAYYATFHELREHVRVLPNEGASLDDSKIGHREVFHRLKSWKHPDPDLRKNLAYAAGLVSMQLIRLIEMRERADYDLSATVNPDDAEKQMLRRADVLGFVARYIKAQEKMSQADVQ